LIPVVGVPIDQGSDDDLTIREVAGRGKADAFEPREMVLIPDDRRVDSSLGDTPREWGRDQPVGIWRRSGG
jgi:hypothetical protein